TLNVKPGEAEIGLRHAFVPVIAGIKEDSNKKIEEKILKEKDKIKNCSDFGDFAKNINSSIDAKMVKTKLSNLSTNCSDKVKDLEIEEISQVFQSGSGFDIFMVCEKDHASPLQSLKKKVREGLYMKKIEIK